jgi:hypothetical protein
VLKFEVKWEGFDKKADRTWEPEENLLILLLSVSIHLLIFVAAKRHRRSWTNTSRKLVVKKHSSLLGRRRSNKDRKSPRSVDVQALQQKALMAPREARNRILQKARHRRARARSSDHLREIGKMRSSVLTRVKDPKAALSFT